VSVTSLSLLSQAYHESKSSARLLVGLHGGPGLGPRRWQERDAAIRRFGAAAGVGCLLIGIDDQPFGGGIDAGGDERIIRHGVGS
jgi:hypothetical protein